MAVGQTHSPKETAMTTNFSESATRLRAALDGLPVKDLMVRVRAVDLKKTLAALKSQENDAPKSEPAWWLAEGQGSFGWALDLMRESERAVRRKSWPDQVYLHIRDFYEREHFDLGEDVELRRLELVDGERCTQVTTFSAEDVLAYDWEMFEE